MAFFNGADFQLTGELIGRLLDWLALFFSGLARYFWLVCFFLFHGSFF